MFSQNVSNINGKTSCGEAEKIKENKLMRLMTVIKLKLKAIELKIRRNILLNLFPLVWRIFLLLGVKAYLHF